jgi:hypothetical protein
VAFSSIVGPQSSIAGPNSTTEVLPVHTWGGFYLGANLGGAWGSTSACDNNTAGDYRSASPSGFTGGVQLGYNWQIGPLPFRKSRSRSLPAIRQECGHALAGF